MCKHIHTLRSVVVFVCVCSPFVWCLSLTVLGSLAFPIGRVFFPEGIKALQGLGSQPSERDRVLAFPLLVQACSAWLAVTHKRVISHSALHGAWQDKGKELQYL